MFFTWLTVFALVMLAVLGVYLICREILFLRQVAALKGVLASQPNVRRPVVLVQIALLCIVIATPMIYHQMPTIQRSIPPIPTVPSRPLEQSLSVGDLFRPEKIIPIPVESAKGEKHTLDNLVLLLDNREMKLSRDRDEWLYRGTDEGQHMILRGKDGGFVFFRGTNASYYHVSGNFQLIPGTDPMGFALILKGGKAYEGAPLGGRGIGINIDRYTNKILVKRYPSDETIVEFPPPENFGFEHVHNLQVLAAPNGEYTVHIDGSEFCRFHDFSQQRGRVGLRIWGDSGVEVTNLSVDKVEPSKFSWDGKALVVISIGIDEYQDRRINRIPQAGRDAESVFKFAQQMKGYNSVLPVLLRNQDVRRANVSYILSVLPQDGGPDDTLLIYFAGHGVALGGGKFYFLMSRTNIGSIVDVQTSAIEMKSIPDDLRSHKYGLIFLVLDHCHAGGVFEVGEKRLVGTFEANEERAQQIMWDLIHTGNPNNLVIFAASRADGKAGDGVFTKHFLDGLGGNADVDNDRKITVREIVLYTTEKVKKEPGEQIPILSGNVAAEGLYDKVLTLVH